MTYSYKYWSAFREADLLNTGDHSISTGDTFVMPGASTVTLAAWDNEGQLSGDSNDHATDNQGSHDQFGWANDGTGWKQTGDLYVEKVYTLHGSDGKTYILAEIEGENKAENEDFFSFVGATPPAGVTLTIGQCENSHGVNYSDLSADPSAAPANTGPVFDNLPGNGVLHIDENTTAVIDVNASDADGDTLTYEIVGGRDQAFFEIDAHTGELSFKDAPDYENPQSGGGSNTYDVTIKVSDGNGGSETKALWVKVEDVAEVQNGWIKGRFTHDADGNDNEWNDDTNTWDEGIEGATIQLLDLDGNVVAATTTDGYGNYMFDVAPGDYRVKFPAQDGKEFSAQNSGVAEHFDSDADANGLTEVIHVTSGGSVHNIDTGVKTAVTDLNCYVIEAEDMDLFNMNIVHGDQASGGELVRTAHLGGTGDLSTTFNGESGTYDLSIFAQDENDGQSSIMVKVNGELVEAFRLDRDSDGGGSNNAGFSEFVIEGVELSQGDEIMIWVDGDHYEWVRIDKIKLQEVEGEPEFRVCDDPDAVNIDFEGLAAGTVVNTQFDGVMISAQRDVNNTAANDAMIFDSNNPTGGDHDLATDSQNNILIVSEDNDSNDPDDAVGGTIWFKFDEPSFVYDIKVVDAEEGGTIRLLDENGQLINEITIPNGTDGGLQQVLIDTDGVAQIDLTLNGSGAVDDLCFVPGEPAPLGSIGGTYFMDNNDNDVQDAGDMGLAGQTVWLLEVGVGVVGTTTTDADGNYLFEDLEAGNYFVRFDGNNVDGKTLVESNVGTDDTIDSDIDNTGTAGNHNTAVITLGEGENVRDVDAGVEDPGTAAIEGTVFMDNNDNSVEDAGDMVVSGVQVELLDANGDVIATATTDGSGNYRFDGLDAGDYSVRFPTTVDGKELVSSNVGGDDTIDSDADEGTGETGTITLGIGDVSSNNDAGIEDPGTGSLAGVVFMDNNDNSVEDAGDMRIANVTVELLNDAGDVIATATTNGNGEYLFDNLNAGDYSVRFPTNLDGKTLVDSNVGGNDDIDSDANTGTGETGTINVGIGENVTDVDAGVEDPGTASIGNLVFLDNDGNGVFNAGDDRVDGVTVELLDENGDVIDTTTTNANGNYLFDNLDAGVYSVRFTAPDGTEFTTEGAAADDATNNDSDADLVTGETDQVTLDIGEAERDVDAGLVLSDTGDAAIEGTVFMDNNDNDVQDAGDMVISGVQVELLDDNGDVIATATTDGSGNYRFDGLDAGDYSVRFPTDVDGKLLVDANQGGDDTVDSDANQGTGETGTISLDIGEVSSNNDAGVRDPGTASLAGVVFMDNNDNSVEDAGDMRIANVAVELLDENGAVVGNTTTNGNGEYEFTNLDAGDYTVRFPTDVNGKVLVDSNAGGDDTIDSDADQGTGETQTVSLGIGERIEDLDAGVEDPAGSAIEGTVFMDNNDNSVQDAGDMAVAGVTVELLDDNGDVIATATTDGSGNYRFDGLEAGDYSVRFPTDVDGKVLVDANQGGDDTVDSDANQGTGETGTITLGINETSSNNDAGVEDPGTASLGDKVFIDTNGNGQQDAGEAGLDGVDVTLFDADGNVAGQTTTQNGGMYLFSGLAAGTYSVGFAEADGFDFTTANQGNDASDSDADQVTGLTGDYTLAIGEENLTVDAGVVAENGAPNPVDDTAMTCADDEVTVNVLSNDSDPDGDALAITEVDGQAITEGGSVTTGAGTVVTLQGGQLVINGEAAYAGLDIGESAVEAISYTISDGVDSSTADVNVTFKGDANDYDSLADSLPATGTFEVTGALANPDAFTLELSNTGDARFDGAVFDQAYCLSFFDPIPLDQGVAGDVTGADNAGVFEADQISGFNGETAADNLDLIQYIVAQNHEGNGTYDGWDVQFAIWELTDNIDTDDFTGIYTEATVANVDAILADAAANGEGFSFGGDGNNVGAIIDPNPQTPGVIEQPFIIGFNFDNYDCIC